MLALDLLGFGLSDKPVMDYSAEIWRDQVGLVCEPDPIAVYSRLRCSRDTTRTTGLAIIERSTNWTCNGV